MVKRFPHQLSFSKGKYYVGPYQNSAGDWMAPKIPDGDRIVEDSPCRAEPVGEGNTIRGEDGEQIAYKFKIYLPKDCPEISPGTMLWVYAGQPEPLVKDTAKRFHRGQLNAQVWV